MRCPHSSHLACFRVDDKRPLRYSCEKTQRVAGRTINMTICRLPQEKMVSRLRIAYTLDRHPIDTALTYILT